MNVCSIVLSSCLYKLLLLLFIFFFYRYDTFIERSCEQLNIAKRQQMNVEITFLKQRFIELV